MLRLDGLEPGCLDLEGVASFLHTREFEASFRVGLHRVQSRAGAVPKLTAFVVMTLLAMDARTRDGATVIISDLAGDRATLIQDKLDFDRIEGRRQDCFSLNPRLTGCFGLEFVDALAKTLEHELTIRAARATKPVERLAIVGGIIGPRGRNRQNRKVEGRLDLRAVDGMALPVYNPAADLPGGIGLERLLAFWLKRRSQDPYASSGRCDMRKGSREIGCTSPAPASFMSGISVSMIWPPLIIAVPREWTFPSRSIRNAYVASRVP